MTGHCLCGGITYELTRPARNQTVCHCDGCRRASGAPAVGWVTVARDSFCVHGEMKYITSPAPAGHGCDSPHTRRGFCPACGTPLVFEDAGRPGEVDVTAGTLDDAGGFKPREDVFAASRLPWVPAFTPAASRTRAALKTQYHGAMAMLKQAIEQCPDELWTAAGRGAPFWQVAYHTLFFVHLYAQPGSTGFVPWDVELEGIEDLRRRPEKVMGKTELLDYWSRCDAMVDVWVDAIDVDTETCGFSWYQLPKLDHQIVNIRHIQHHAAILAARLREADGTDIRWVGGKTS
jgi:hypothetical protein